MKKRGKVVLSMILVLGVGASLMSCNLLSNEIGKMKEALKGRELSLEPLMKIAM